MARSPRSATHLVHHLEAHHFLKPSVIPLKTDVPQLAEYLWAQTTAYQKAALQSGYVQGLKSVALNPEGFGGYMVQDSVFCFKAQGNIDIAVTNATDAILRKFLEARSESYKAYYQSLFDTWHIEDASGIKLGTECTEYVNHEHNVATTMNSIYFVVAMIPCAKLWPWIGQQINAIGGSFGVYDEWVKANFNPDSSGVEKYEKLINTAEQDGHIDRKIALDVYTASMKGEAGFFGSIKVK
ncbi:uncharacterized protein LOC127831628 [Dreissena polymorpha]|uniref:Thiaminase-2/PQQC domain-containing protein n=1 Tax=Dreissena polymorpha TaxID=45954 RepID=A0A9D4GP05_DREPO|nr:uncharacterized protein LOC127831628 [Dreissena polymorpha]XP_052212569.1 uncharacterized protein LOC127831628 [Dreissena polymorpha]XP_052212570.1 uncharacterized protein LOC127831628 [Dreissena polymorpha]KAH3819073.1 hypothetical protein DPMN_120803 [Dreissena polymorpha]